MNPTPKTPRLDRVHHQALQLLGTTAFSWSLVGHHAPAAGTPAAGAPAVWQPPLQARAVAEPSAALRASTL